MVSTTLLSECVTMSDQRCSLRVIHVLVGEGIARVQALREGLGSGTRVSSNLCLAGPSGFEWLSPTVVDCQTSVLCFHCGRTHSADPRTRTCCQASFSPSHLASAEDTLRLLSSRLLAEIMADPLWTATALSSSDFLRAASG